MDKGDFFVHFMDLTEEELKKPVDDIVPTRMEALLELALRMSTANTDPFKDDLKVHGKWAHLLVATEMRNRWESKLIVVEVKDCWWPEAC